MAITTISNALAAYAQVAKSATGGGDSSEADASNETGADFASLLKTGVKAAVEASKRGEEQTKLGLTGKADIRDVVAAVNNAEVTLQTVMAVRDKVINAYNDILKMPI